MMCLCVFVSVCFCGVDSMTTKVSKPAAKKIPVSRRALEGRVRRALAKESLVLHKCKTDSKWFNELGEYYLTEEHGGMSAQHQDLETLAKEYGVLREFEELVDE